MITWTIIDGPKHQEMREATLVGAILGVGDPVEFVVAPVVFPCRNPMLFFKRSVRVTPSLLKKKRMSDGFLCYIFQGSAENWQVDGVYMPFSKNDDRGVFRFLERRA